MMLSQSLTQTLELSQSQRLVLTQGYRLDLRLRLIGALHGGEGRPQATCPACGHGLSALEIMKGFRPDPHDLTTGCPKPECKQRFQPKLIWSNAAGRKELLFYCALQTREMLRGLETLSPEELEKRNPAAYHSAVAHYGSLKNMFAEMKVVYAFDEIADAKTKIEPFLGKLFDTTIAKLSGVDIKVVRQMRKSAKISRCVTEGDTSDE